MPHTPNRVVPVAVDVIVHCETGTVDIVCTPSPADIVKDTPDALLVFTLRTSGFRFPLEDAITLDVPLEDFPYPSWTLSDTQAALYDCNVVADTIAYTVTVVNNSTGHPYSVDPEIKNGGSSVGNGDGDGRHRRHHRHHGHRGHHGGGQSA